MNSLPSERAALVGRIDPQTVANVELFTDVVDMSKFHEVLGVALLGNMAAETIDFKAYTCASDGTGAVLLKAATQRAAHATNNDNKQIELNVKGEKVAASGQRYVKFGLVTGNTTGGPACVVALGMKPRFGPASDNDLASVVEIS